jgi:osmoprotectant transport system permease protein
METLVDGIQWLLDSGNYRDDPATFIDTNIPVRFYEHLQISSQAVLLAVVIAIPLGLYIGHTRRFEFLAISVGNLGRALPSFGILGFVFPFTLDWPGEIGFWATFVALVLLAIPPILTNTYIGVKTIDADTLEAARAMGMTEWGLLQGLEAPLAVPLMIAGTRTAAVQVVATATLGALAGWGGLGRFIVDGKAQGDIPQLVGGAILVALLAILTEVLFSMLERVLSPREASSGRKRRSQAGVPQTSAA